MKNIELAFKELVDLLEQFDALEFLCQASMTYLFTPEGTFHSEADEVQHWSRRIEFAAGFYTARNSTGSKPVTAWDIEAFAKLADDYYDSAMMAKLPIANGREFGRSASASARIHSMYVRGEAYPHQFQEYGEELYGQHDHWFVRTLGFTISDAYSLFSGMRDELNKRINVSRSDSLILAEKIVDNDSSWRHAGIDRDEAIIRSRAYLVFGRAKQIFAFTWQDVLNCSNLDPNICAALLRRLAQRPSYRNPQFPETFTRPQDCPWDYNTISERPIITDGSLYWVVVPHLFRESLFYTFYFDLMADKSYRPTFENSRGKYLENKVATYLKRVFPQESVILNPSYPDGNEFCDVLVLFDGKILIVQCKSKTLTRGARIGESAAAIRTDVQKAIKEAISQGTKCKVHLQKQENATLLVDGVRANIHMEFVTSIDILAVTFMPLQMMATRIRDIETDLGLPHSEYPAWATALGDLDIVTQICHSPARFFQYVRRRLMLEEADISVKGDEMDLLGFFLTQGLWMKDERFTGYNSLAIAGLSTQVDEYVYRRWDEGESVPIPEVPRPEGFYPIVEAIEGLYDLHRTDCAITVLELSGEASDRFVRAIKQTKEKTVEDHESHSFSIQGEEGVTGISFQAFPSDYPPEEAARRTEGFGLLKKYAERLKSWVAINWRENSGREIDSSFWLSFNWVLQEKLEPHVETLRAGRKNFPDA